MNTWTKFYGLIGLVSTMGKNGFNISQRVSEFNKTVCHYAEQAFANLKQAADYSAKFNEKAKEKCREWEQWAEKKHEQAERQEELNEDWNKLNEKYSLPQPTKKSLFDLTMEKKRELLPEKRFTQEGDVHCPSRLEKALSLGLGLRVY